ncbi:flagellar biosynthesis protein FlgJ [Aliidiomarina taiwanensis]|uniref:Flagellar biosynthesis protein FlgJ n=2 Tax=Aliidiomarina taiwanensis TaxID=946228 RepID=A0A432X1C5_9GAMM|nr:flagellar biosynthesis protein FlgJ [Aliidiomarina taiwanensis]
MKNKLLLIAVVVFVVLGTLFWLTTQKEEEVFIPDFSEYAAGPERKAAFFAYFAPIITEINAEIMNERAQIEQACSVGNTHTVLMQRLAEKYYLKDILGAEGFCQAMLERVDRIPPSLALAQSANESAWGTSRFAREGNNYFGQWCFSKGCGIVPQGRGANKTHEVAVFETPKDSVQSYILNLNRHTAYEELRAIRAQLRSEGKTVSGIELSHGLSRYSERGVAYGEELRDMIRYNKLTDYD